MPAQRSGIVLRCLVVVTLVSIVVNGLQTDESRIEWPTKDVDLQLKQLRLAPSRGLISLNSKVKTASPSSNTETGSSKAAEAKHKKFNGDSSVSGDGEQQETEEASKSVESTMSAIAPVSNEKSSGDDSQKEEPRTVSALSETSPNIRPTRVEPATDDLGANESSSNTKKNKTKLAATTSTPSTENSSEERPSQISSGDSTNSPTSSSGISDPSPKRSSNDGYSADAVGHGTGEAIDVEGQDSSSMDDQQRKKQNRKDADTTKSKIKKNDDQENNKNHDGDDPISESWKPPTTRVIEGGAPVFEMNEINNKPTDPIVQTLIPSTNSDRKDDIATLASSTSGETESNPGKSNNGNGNGKAKGNGNGNGKEKSNGDGNGEENGTATTDLVSDSQQVRGVPPSASTAALGPSQLDVQIKATPVLASPDAGAKSTSTNTPRGENSITNSPTTRGSDSQRTAGGPSNKDSVVTKEVPEFEVETSEIPTSNMDATSPTSVKQTSGSATISDTKDTSNNEKQDKQATRIEAMSVQTLDAATEQGKQYVRGDAMFSGIVDEDGSSIFAEGGDGSSPLVIGGKKRGWQAETQSGLYATSSSFHNTLRFSVCAAAIVSVGLLLVFHFEVLNKGLARHFPPGSMWTPNTWEFAMYAQYIQHIAAISALTLLKTPYFLWEFTDLFSWANFLVYRAQNDSTASERRLATIILGGLVGYGDRIGTSEVDLMYQTISGFALVLGFFLGILSGATLYNKWREHIGEKGRRGVIWRCLGLVPLVWFSSLLPLTMAVSFEVSMELKASMLESWPLVIAFLVIALVICGVTGVVARTLLHSTERGLRRLRSRALWGAFYADCKYGGRLFFLLVIVQQVCMGLSMGILDDSMVILVLLVTLHVMFLVAVCLVKPFQDGTLLVKRGTYAITIVKLVNLALAFAFLPMSILSLTGLYRVANTLIGLNSIVIIVWCIRHILIFGKLVIASAKVDLENRNTRDVEAAFDISPSSYQLAVKTRY
ncbi:hypothetical protein JG688_00014491 [Phytophthora aleatoria]|uniref:TRP C-terminal domain-containing protein n=1 Tax=Phytophthora aleatoria TaxID=2496075 RepID=A0A8J5IWW9_9STRA|nr:hypothetical protein JG688_00014491 [Phytophthora aleatoria]